jgi:hypothetical protein
MTSFVALARAGRSEVEGVHFIAGKDLRTSTGQPVSMAFDPTARDFFFGGTFKRSIRCTDPFFRQ